MNILLRILLGTVVSVVGFFVVWKAENVTGLVGRSWWAENTFQGFGGTSGLVKIIGILVIFIGFMIMTGGINDILGGVAGILVPESL